MCPFAKSMHTRIGVFATLPSRYLLVNLFAILSSISNSSVRLMKISLASFNENATKLPSFLKRYSSLSSTE